MERGGVVMNAEGGPGLDSPLVRRDPHSLRDLRAMKEARGSTQDRADLEALPRRFPATGETTASEAVEEERSEDR